MSGLRELPLVQVVDDLREAHNHSLFQRAGVREFSGLQLIRGAEHLLVNFHLAEHCACFCEPRAEILVAHRRVLRVLFDFLADAHRLFPERVLALRKRPGIRLAGHAGVAQQVALFVQKLLDAGDQILDLALGRFRVGGGRRALETRKDCRLDRNRLCCESGAHRTGGGRRVAQRKHGFLHLLVTQGAQVQADFRCDAVGRLRDLTPDFGNLHLAVEQRRKQGRRRVRLLRRAARFVEIGLLELDQFLEVVMQLRAGFARFFLQLAGAAQRDHHRARECHAGAADVVLIPGHHAEGRPALAFSDKFSERDFDFSGVGLVTGRLLPFADQLRVGLVTGAFVNGDGAERIMIGCRELKRQRTVRGRDDFTSFRRSGDVDFRRVIRPDCDLDRIRVGQPGRVAVIDFHGLIAHDFAVEIPAGVGNPGDIERRVSFTGGIKALHRAVEFQGNGCVRARHDVLKHCEILEFALPEPGVGGWSDLRRPRPDGGSRADIDPVRGRTGVAGFDIIIDRLPDFLPRKSEFRLADVAVHQRLLPARAGLAEMDPDRLRDRASEPGREPDFTSVRDDGVPWRQAENLSARQRGNVAGGEKNAGGGVGEAGGFHEAPDAERECDEPERQGEAFKQRKIEHVGPADLRERVVHFAEKGRAHRGVCVQFAVELHRADEHVAGAVARHFDAAGHAGIGDVFKQRRERQRESRDQRGSGQQEAEPAARRAKMKLRVAHHKNREEEERDRQAGDEMAGPVRPAEFFRRRAQALMDEAGVQGHGIL